MPLYNQDDDTNQAESVKRLKKEINGAHGLLFVAPEYNRSIPGVLKNAIDHRACDFQLKYGFVMIVLFSHCCFLSR